MVKEIRIGDESLYAVKPPAWKFVIISIIGVIIGMYYGTTFLGLMLLALAYYMNTALKISQAGLGSILMLILVIIVLIILKPKFEMGFKYIMVFLISMLIGIALATALILNGYSISPPIDIHLPFQEGTGNNTTADNSQNYPTNLTALVYQPSQCNHPFFVLSSPLMFFLLPIFMYVRRRGEPDIKLDEELKPTPLKIKLALILAIGIIIMSISTSFIVNWINEYFIKQHFDIYNPIFLIFMFGLFIFGVYTFKVSLKNL